MGKDGVANIAWQHAAQSERITVDANEDGQLEYEMILRTDGDTQYYERVRDTDRDGLPDERVSFEVRAGESTATVLVETDPMQTGRFTKLKSFDMDLLLAKSQGPRFAMGDQACENQAELTDDYERGIDLGLQCLTRSAPAIAAMFRRQLLQHPVAIECFAEQPCEDPTSPNCRVLCGYARDAGSRLEPGAETYIQIVAQWGGTCGDPAVTIFHEILHYVIGPHIADNQNDSDPIDPVLSCEAMCFGCQRRNAEGVCRTDELAEAADECRLGEGSFVEPRGPDSDACLVRTWISQSLHVDGHTASGGQGMRLSLDPDGSGFVTYVAMTEGRLTPNDNDFGIDSRYRYEGAGFIRWATTADGQLAIAYDDPSAFRMVLDITVRGAPASHVENTFAELQEQTGAAPLSSVPYTCEGDEMMLIMSDPASGAPGIETHWRGD